jgi:hypothetical protein
MTPEGADGPRWMTLGRLLSNLEPGLLRPLVTPAGTDVPVGGAQLYAGDSAVPLDPAAVVLAVGLSPESKEARLLVRRAGHEGAAGVIFQGNWERDASAGVLDAATRACVAVLGVDPDVSWDQLYRLLRAAANRTGDLLEAPVATVPAGDLFALATAVAAMAGGPVTIEDPTSRVLAYSNLSGPIDRFRRGAILRREISARWKKRLGDAGVSGMLQRSDEAFRIDAFGEEGMRPRMAIGVRAGNELLGSIWVAEGDQPFGAKTARVLRDAARIAALHLVAYRAGREIERSSQGRQLEFLLEGRGSADGIAELLGLESDAQYVAIALQPVDTADEATRAIQVGRILNLTAAFWEAFRRRAVCTRVAQTAYALLPVPTQVDRGLILSMTAQLVRHIEGALKIASRAGVGSIVESLTEAPRSRIEADQVLHLMRGDADSRVGDVEGMRGRIFLLEVEGLVRAQPRMTTGKLNSLIRHDAEHRTEYVATVLSYLTSFGEVVAAAEAMAVHPKTFRHRLRRAVEIAGIDFDNRNERLVTQLQGRLH